MFPIGVIEKVAEAVLGPVAQHFFKKKDEKQRFAQSLMRYYYGLRDYAEAVGELRRHLDEQKRWGGVMAPATVDRVRGLSTHLADLVEEFLGTYEFHVARDAKSTRSRRQAAVIDIYDQQLSSMIQAAHAHDLVVTRSDSAIGSWIVDYDKQTINLLDQTAPDLGKIMFAYSFEEKYEPPPRPGSHYLTLKFKSDDDFAKLMRMIDENAIVVGRLRKRVSGFLKEHFEVSDFL